VTSASNAGKCAALTLEAFPGTHALILHPSVQLHTEVEVPDGWAGPPWTVRGISRSARSIRWSPLPYTQRNRVGQGSRPIWSGQLRRL